MKSPKIYSPKDILPVELIIYVLVWTCSVFYAIISFTRDSSKCMKA